MLFMDVFAKSGSHGMKIERKDKSASGASSGMKIEKKGKK